ncbi:hypothetical protein K2173_022283 [Erythroxylum novogranatense]|uniref:Secreted protein n=1 Tax=Erythroxylum novogranatense TaxID=1862640 RepID=A0AAV8TJ80_9ROSI|nr:hypothetical protein K2173_022283 [Erythroxylum novogranatense]
MVKRNYLLPCKPACRGLALCLSYNCPCYHGELPPLLADNIPGPPTFLSPPFWLSLSSADSVLHNLFQCWSSKHEREGVCFC